MTEGELAKLLRAWCAAEVEANLDALTALTAPDFAMVGPFGFLLPKQAWLDRYRSGDLLTTGLEHAVDDTRSYGDTSIVVGTLQMTATHRGQPAGGTFRSTHVIVARGEGLVIAGLHLSLRHPPVGPAA